MQALWWATKVAAMAPSCYSMLLTANRGVTGTDVHAYHWPQLTATRISRYHDGFHSHATSAFMQQATGAPSAPLQMIHTWLVIACAISPIASRPCFAGDMVQGLPQS